MRKARLALEIDERAERVSRAAADQERESRVAQVAPDLAGAYEQRPAHENEDARVNDAALRPARELVAKGRVEQTKQRHRPDRDHEDLLPWRANGVDEKWRVGARDE